MFYEYDTMKSPFQGFIGYIGRDMHYGEWGSRNNSVMDSISTPFVDMQECVHFAYEYVDGYPVKRTHIIPKWWNGWKNGGAVRIRGIVIILHKKEPRPTIPDNRIGMKLQAGGVEKIISLFRAFFVPLHDYWIINEYI